MCLCALAGLFTGWLAGWLAASLPLLRHSSFRVAASHVLVLACLPRLAMLCSCVVVMCYSFAGSLYPGSSFPSYVAIFISHVFSLPLRSLSSLPPFSPSPAVVVLGFHVGGGREGGGRGARNPSLACGVSPLQARLFFMFRTAGGRAAAVRRGGAGTTQRWPERRVAEGEALGKR